MRACSVRISAGWAAPRWTRDRDMVRRRSACTRPAQRTERLHGARRARGPRHPRCVRRGPVDRRRAGIRRAPQPLPFARLVGAVEFVDDGLSTNVLPAQAALQAFAGRPVALLVGGHDRGVDYAPLGRTIAARTAPTLVVTMPDNGPRIGQAVRDAGDGSVEVIDAASLDAAVDAAVRVGPGRRRRPALSGRPELRALR